MRWPREQLKVQVDDSTDPVLRAMIDEVVEREQESGTNVHVMRREERSGYKAGALEAGRKQTDARFLVLFDADFIPSADFIERTVSRFYDETGDERTTLALVQAQWGHLNPASSMLRRISRSGSMTTTRCRCPSLCCVRLHPSRARRARRPRRSSGRRLVHKSLVEDCELSFRVLFSGYTTSFVRDVVQQSENGRGPRQGAAEAVDAGVGAAHAAARHSLHVRVQLLQAARPPLPHAHRIAMATVVSMAGHVSVAHRST